MASRQDLIEQIDGLEVLLVAAVLEMPEGRFKLSDEKLVEAEKWKLDADAEGLFVVRKHGP